MKYTPDSICRIVAGSVNITECHYMIKCVSGMSALIGNVWKLSQGKWIELEKIDWPMDMSKAPYSNNVRWGSMGKGDIQINVTTSKVKGIYTYDGIQLSTVTVKNLS